MACVTPAIATMRCLTALFTAAGLVVTAAVASPAEFWEHRGLIVAEIEDAALRAAVVSAREDASGGKVVTWHDETGRAELTLRVFTPGVWHVWIRTAAKDHVSNGLYLELNGVRLRAPAGHRWPGVDAIYLRKHAVNFFWKPEWQGPGEGNHAGPIAIEIPHAGVHRLAIVARKIERPTLDKIVLTRSATPDFVDDGKAHGPKATTEPPR
jgi:hypothetical protein